MNTDAPYSWLNNGYHGIGNAFSKTEGIEVRACNCIGPQPGQPRCPCQMGAYREEQAGKEALAILRKMTVKPRVRVKAISA